MFFSFSVAFGRISCSVRSIYNLSEKILLGRGRLLFKCETLVKPVKQFRCRERELSLLGLRDVDLSIDFECERGLK